MAGRKVISDFRALASVGDEAATAECVAKITASKTMACRPVLRYLVIMGIASVIEHRIVTADIALLKSTSFLR